MKRTERVEPIKPKDIIDNLDDIIHPAVIKAVNELLKEKYRGSEVNIKQKDIVAKILSINPEITTKEIDEKKWMDFEPIFIKAGWIVKYDKAAYNEDYDSYFTFSAKK